MRLIDADAFMDYIDAGHLRSCRTLCFCEDDVVNMTYKQPTIKAIDEDWIVKQIQSTSGAESSYYARLLHKWRDEHGIIS